ncbi:MAG: hypothetical protein HY332_16505 [Chloroflexi bacterium]|nr:hypothetical protein [Chloroflexota bacterium]
MDTCIQAAPGVHLALYSDRSPRGSSTGRAPFHHSPAGYQEPVNHVIPTRLLHDGFHRFPAGYEEPVGLLTVDGAPGAGTPSGLVCRHRIGCPPGTVLTSDRPEALTDA